MVAKASGVHNVMVAVEPAIMVQQKNIRKNTTKAGIGRPSKKTGNFSMTLAAVSKLRNIMRIKVFTMIFGSKEDMI